jgi:hypothetical protein
MKTRKKDTKESDYIVIPNPIYDVVFRYLMQDYDSAIIILSTLINEKIKSLDFQPLTYAKKTSVSEHNEHFEKKVNKHFEKEKKKILADKKLSELDKNIAISEITVKDPATGRDVKLLHLDFAAVIEKENGEEELVMIELQKAALGTDIFRFKQYISENFHKKRKIIQADPDTGQEFEIEMPYRLIPIFILNFKIEDDICDLMIKTRQIKTGVFTEKEMDKKNAFIDHLSYELYVVQLPYLQAFENHDFSHDEYRQKLFALLKLFDQNAKKTNNEYRLRLFRRIFPGFLDRVIKRLQTADSDNPDLEKQMQAEDYYLKPLMQRDNKIAWFVLNKKEMETKLKDAKKALKDEKAKAKQALQDEKAKAKQALEEKNKALEDEKAKAKQALEEKNKAKQALEDEKIKAKQLQFELAKMLKESGVPTEVIRQKTNLTIEEIEKL